MKKDYGIQVYKVMGGSRCGGGFFVGNFLAKSPWLAIEAAELSIKASEELAACVSNWDITYLYVEGYREDGHVST